MTTLPDNSSTSLNMFMRLPEHVTASKLKKKSCLWSPVRKLPGPATPVNTSKHTSDGSSKCFVLALPISCFALIIFNLFTDVDSLFTYQISKIL